MIASIDVDRNTHQNLEGNHQNEIKEALKLNKLS
jgi:hypothetical protein